MKKNKAAPACQSRLKTSIGGQALIEGIMMRGPQTTAMAVRNPEGEIVLETWPTEVGKRAKFFRLPFVRGIFNFIDTMKFGYKCLMRSAEIAGLDDLEDDKSKSDKKNAVALSAESTDIESENETSPEDAVSDVPTVEVPAEATTSPEEEQAKEPKKQESSALMNVIMVISVVLAVVLAFTLFFWLPAQIYMWLPDGVFSPNNRFLKSIVETILRVVLLIGYMGGVSLMKDIRRTYMFHGAEHKTIFCYEAGLELTVENIRGMRRFHPRCGTSFLIIMVLVSAIIGFLIPPSLPTLLRVAIKVLLIPLVVGIGYELIKLAGRHDNLLTRIISAPGLWLQRLTVFEPDDGMIECAIVAMKQAIPDDGSDKI